MCRISGISPQPEPPSNSGRCRLQITPHRGRPPGRVPLSPPGCVPLGPDPLQEGRGAAGTPPAAGGSGLGARRGLEDCAGPAVVVPGVAMVARRRGGGSTLGRPMAERRPGGSVINK